MLPRIFKCVTGVFSDRTNGTTWVVSDRESNLVSWASNKRILFLRFWFCSAVFVDFFFANAMQFALYVLPNASLPQAMELLIWESVDMVCSLLQMKVCGERIWQRMLVSIRTCCRHMCGPSISSLNCLVQWTYLVLWSIAGALWSLSLMMHVMWFCISCPMPKDC